MNEIESFLSDEFVEFSSKMGNIHAQLKEKNEATKKIVEQYKKEKEVLEASAKALLNTWNIRKNNNDKK